VFFGILDTQTGEFAYCSAGHPSALIRSADGLVRALAVGSTIIGAFEEIEVRDGSECLGPGETLVLYTDGITEAHCADGLFGEERLIRALSLADVDPVEMPATLIAAIESYPDAVLPDDAALLCLQLSAPVSSCTRGA
jgi:sigma-B regulation protein RsbU (phosphoserine phosphatase)